MKTYDCDKCYAQTESEEDLHLTEHIGCGGTWIWADGFSMTEPLNAERIAKLEAQLAAAERDAWNAAIAAAAEYIEAACDRETAKRMRESLKK